MNNLHTPTWIAFARSRRIAFGQPEDVALQVKAHLEKQEGDGPLVFDAVSGRPVDLDLARLGYPLDEGANASQPPPFPTPDIRLLPRHWEWLSTQTGGASAALRKLVEQAMRTNKEQDRVRLAREATYRFMSAMAGNAPGFEEATRALFAGHADQFQAQVAAWPADVRQHVLALAAETSPRSIPSIPVAA